MMYTQKLLAAIKANGKVLREFKDTVLVPFSSEYSILLKNLNNVRALIHIQIDGNQVIPGGLVLSGGQEIDLERFVKNGNLNEGNRFKFIERTSAIEDNRGVKLEDGIVRIEFQFERQSVVYPPVYHSKDTWPLNYPPGARSLANYSSEQYSAQTLSATGMTRSIVTKSAVANDAGITVPGSKSDQKFSQAGWFPTETEKHVIILKLVGETADNKMVIEPVTVDVKPKCETCGKVNKATAKFCSECGTSLILF